MRKQLPILVFCLAVVPLVAAPSWAQNSSLDFSPSGISYTHGRKWWATLFGQAPVPVGPADVRNSARVYALLHNGQLALTLDDAIALALENNLDIAIQRYNLSIADTDILRARAGQAPHGVNTGVLSGTPGGGAATVTGAGSTGAGSGGTIAGSGGAGSGIGGIVTTEVGAGPPVPDFDPTFTTAVQASDAATPQSESFLTGSTQLVAHTGETNFTYSQAWSPGTSLAVDFTNTRSTNNNSHNLFNPTLNSGLTLTLTQPLLYGFGSSVNGRNLVISNNNREIADIAFREQVESTVTQVEEIYWDTVSARDSVKVAGDALNTAKVLLTDDQRQVQIGTMAPLSVTQQEAAVATDEQNLVTAQTNYEYQKLLLLNAVTKNMNDPALINADVTPTDPITIPANEAIQPIQDLINQALAYRPELAISRVQINNNLISMHAVKNELEPQLNLVASYGANAIAGVVVPGTSPADLPGLAPFIGGYGTGFSSLIQGNYPTYTLGLNLSIPIANHGAQADVIAAQLELRQSRLQYQQQTNTIVLEVRNAAFTLQQDRAAVAAAEEAVKLDQQTLTDDQKSLQVGVAVITTVMTDESNLTLAQNQLVAARSNYVIARVQLDQLIGRTLEADRISIQDAENGRVTQLPQAPK